MLDGQGNFTREWVYWLNRLASAADVVEQILPGEIQNNLDDGGASLQESMSTQDMESRLEDLEGMLLTLPAVAEPEAGETVPVGTVTAFRFSTIPANWLELNGQTVNRADYPALSALYGGGGATMTLDDWRNRPLWGDGTQTIGVIAGYDDRSCIADLSGANTTWTGTGESVLTIANNTGTTSPSVVTTAPYAADAVVDHSHTIPTGNTGSAGGHSHTLSGTVDTVINVVGTHTHTIAGGNHDHTVKTFEYQGAPSGGEPVTNNAFSVLPKRAIVKWIIKAR